MKAVDYSLRFGALLLALFCALSIFLLPSKLETVLTTIKHSKEVNAQFLELKNFAIEFRERTGQLPNTDQVSEWYYAKYLPSEKYVANHSGLVGFSVDPPNCGEHLQVPSRSTDGKSFCLSHWRGEWFEYFASWSNQSSMSFSPSAYFVTGTEFGEGIVFGAILLGSLFCVWRGFSPLLSKLRSGILLIESRVRARQT
jgi:hypothetical protein